LTLLRTQTQSINQSSKKVGNQSWVASNEIAFYSITMKASKREILLSLLLGVQGSASESGGSLHILDMSDQKKESHHRRSKDCR
jgi:hypothetical protein